MKDIYQLLHKYWGVDTFRPLQEDIITSVLQGHDTLALLPTGGGKSLCYQLPALASEGIAIVVSPLIALMKDQVQHLMQKGIKAACLVSGMNLHEQEVVLNNALYGGMKLLYVSPERLKNKTFLAHFSQMKVSLIAVDEAHCISQWGYDFRPAYLDIAAIRHYHPQAPLVALTATATPEVVVDIQKQLSFRHEAFFKTSFYRKNLSYMVFHETDKVGRLLRIASKVGGAGVVYVRNRRRTQEVAATLRSHGVSASFYHAGLSPKERDLRQSQWMSGLSRVMVATNAFGMGVDKSDVRFVVHLDIPASVEAYFQEAGRAGRDGLTAYAVLLYDTADLETMAHDFETDFPSVQYIQNVYRAVCNFYQIPLGSGFDTRFDFDIEKICQNYGFQPLPLYNALRFLEREGLISVPDREDVESRLMIVANKEDLYRFQVDNKRYEPLVQQLLRTYGGLFSDFVPISERKLAAACYTNEETVERMLSHLDALKLVSYKKHASGPQIYFTSPRLDVSFIYFSGSHYHELKAVALKRLEAMKDYVTDTTCCRSQRLLSYFGETASSPCGVCDVCIVQRKQAVDDTLSQRIVALLRQGPLTMQQLMEHIKGQYVIDERCVEDAVHQLLDERAVAMNADFQLYV